MSKEDFWPVPRLKLTRFSKIAAIFTTTFVGVTSRLFASYLNKTKIHNNEQLLDLVFNRPKNKSLITVCNHDSCCDDPLLFGACLPMSTFTRLKNYKLLRWSLGAQEICHSSPLHSMFFQLGKVMPIVRGNGIYQPIMNEMIDELNNGHWVHIFPEGKVNEKKEFIRLKWGVGRLVSDAVETPIVLPIWHMGYDDILPNQPPYRPQLGKRATVVVGKPIYFDSLVKQMRENKNSALEIRKRITDLIQEEFYKLKEVTQKHHDQHLSKL